LASALRERRNDQKRTKPRDKKSPHIAPPSQLQMNALPEPKTSPPPDRNIDVDQSKIHSPDAIIA
jgi:hypothetical protein